MERARWALLVLVALVLAPVPLVVTAVPAQACSCVELTPEEVWDSADVVVVGHVTDRRGDPDGFDELSYEVRVSTVYRGSVSEVLTFTAHASSGACGWLTDPSDDDRVLILTEIDGELSTNICTMSQATPIPDAYVGTDYPPEGGGSGLPAGGTWTPLWLGLGLGVVVLGGLWLVLRRPLR